MNKTQTLLDALAEIQPSTSGDITARAGTGNKDNITQLARNGYTVMCGKVVRNDPAGSPRRMYLYKLTDKGEKHLAKAKEEFSPDYVKPDAKPKKAEAPKPVQGKKTTTPDGFQITVIPTHLDQSVLVLPTWGTERLGAGMRC